MTPEHRHVRGEQRHVERAAGLLRERPQGVDALRGDHAHLARAAEARRGRARLVRGKHKLPSAVEGRAPVRQLFLQHGARQRGALPRGEIAEVDVAGRERRVSPGKGGGIRAREVRHHHAERPGVGDDVVCQQQHEVIVRRQPHHRDPKERLPREVERRLGHGAQRRHRRRESLSLGTRTDIVSRDDDGPRRTHLLHRRVAGRGEHRPQRLVAGDQRRHGAIERSEIQRPAHAPHDRRVIRRESGRRPLKKPEHLLGAGQWYRRTGLARSDMRRTGAWRC